MTIFQRLIVAAAAFGLLGATRPSERVRGTEAKPASLSLAVPLFLQGASSEVAAGAKLFVAYNCGDCHGAGGSGAMGPSLQDNRWRFGGTAEEIYRSIADGRPEGMPAWGPMIPAAHIRQLVAYTQSLGVGKDVTTENFTGATVERAGR